MLCVVMCTTVFPGRDTPWTELVESDTKSDVTFIKYEDRTSSQGDPESPPSYSESIRANSAQSNSPA